MPGAKNDFAGEVTFDDQVTLEDTWWVSIGVGRGMLLPRWLLGQVA